MGWAGSQRPRAGGAWLGPATAGRDAQVSKKQETLAGSMRRGDMRMEDTDGLDPSLPWWLDRFSSPLHQRSSHETWGEERARLGHRVTWDVSAPARETEKPSRRPRWLRASQSPPVHMQR